MKANEHFQNYLGLFQNLIMTKWEFPREDSILLLLLENWTSFLTNQTVSGLGSPEIKQIFDMNLFIFKNFETITYFGTTKETLV